MLVALRGSDGLTLASWTTFALSASERDPPVNSGRNAAQSGRGDYSPL